MTTNIGSNVLRLLLWAVACLLSGTLTCSLFLLRNGDHIVLYAQPSFLSCSAFFVFVEGHEKCHDWKDRALTACC